MSDVDSFDELLVRVGRMVEVALSFWEAARPAQLEPVVQNRFANTEAGHTFVALRQAALWQASLATSRLWDSNKRSASLHQVFRNLKCQPGLVNELCRRRAHRVRDAEERWRTANAVLMAQNPMIQMLSDRDMAASDLVGQETKSEINSLITLFEKHRDHRIKSHLEALRSFRDVRLAHWDLGASPKISAAGQASLRDLIQCLGTGARFIEQADGIVLGYGKRFRQHRLVRRRYALAYWHQREATLVTRK